MQTLLCLRGRDLPARTLLIQAASILLVIITSGLFYGLSMRPTAVSLVALLMAGFGYCAARRRLNDAGVQPVPALASPFTWLLFALAQWASTGANWSYGLLLLPVGVALGLAWLPSRPIPTGAPIRMGYLGPALGRTVMPAPRRIEPSMDGRAPVNPALLTSAEPELEAADSRGAWEPTGAPDPLRNWLAALSPWLGWRRAPLLLLGPLLLLLVWALLPARFSDNAPGPETAAQSVTVQPESLPEFDHRVVMADNYELLLAQNGVILRWPGDPAAPGTHWSQLTAQGERRCQSARFNSGSEYRPIKVEVWGEDHYYAFFSALDTHALLYDVAMRGSFQLCGYDFSLRGSMDLLRADPAFALYTRKPN